MDMHATRRLLPALALLLLAGCQRAAPGHRTPDAAAAAPPASEATAGGQPAPSTGTAEGRAEEQQGASPGTPAVVSRAQQKCGTPGCIDHVTQTVAGPGEEPLPPPPELPRQPRPAEPPPPAAPLPAGLAAHLERIPDGSGSGLEVFFVAQSEVPATLPADALRGAARALASAAGEALPGDPTCFIDWALAVRNVTFAHYEYDETEDQDVVLVDGEGLDLPGLVECAQHVLREVVPPEAMAAAREGYLEIEDLAASAMGPGAVAFGTREILRQVRAGGLAAPLSRWPEYRRLRDMAGPGPAYAVFRGSRRGTTAAGAVALRIGARVGLVGALRTSGEEWLEPLGEALEESLEVLAELRRRRADVVAALAVDPQSRTTVDALVDAVLDARFAVQGTTLTFEVWLPEGLALDSLLPMVARALPRLAAGF